MLQASDRSSGYLVRSRLLLALRTPVVPRQPDEKPCPACGTPLNLDLNILTLYANVSGTASGPASATASHDDVIIPGRPAIPVTFIPAPITEGYHFGPDVSGAVKALVVLEVLQQKLTTGMSEFLSVFKSAGAKKVPLWLVELLKWSSTTPRQISEEEARLKQELNDLKQQKLALEEELAQQLQVEMELEQQLAHRREAREMRPPKKARV